MSDAVVVEMEVRNLISARSIGALDVKRVVWRLRGEVPHGLNKCETVGEGEVWSDGSHGVDVTAV